MMSGYVAGLNALGEAFTGYCLAYASFSGTPISS